jgi:hypothetical protein
MQKSNLPIYKPGIDYKFYAFHTLSDSLTFLSNPFMHQIEKHQKNGMLMTQKKLKVLTGNLFRCSL